MAIKDSERVELIRYGVRRSTVTKVAECDNFGFTLVENDLCLSFGYREDGNRFNLNVSERDAKLLRDFLNRSYPV